jgi:hypothetical protein
MQDREHHAVSDGIEELVGMPARGEWPGLRLAVADNAGDDQVGVVVGRTVRVRNRVSQFTTLVYRAGVSGATWLGMPPGNENW